MATEVRRRRVVDLACEHLSVELEDLAGRGRSSEIVKMRELIGTVGIERFGVKVAEPADVLGKSRDGVSCRMSRGVKRRATDPNFAAAAEQLEHLASEEPRGRNSADRCRALLLLLLPLQTQLLILDDIGLYPMSSDQRRDLMEVIEDRAQRRSTLRHLLDQQRRRRRRPLRRTRRAPVTGLPGSVGGLGWQPPRSTRHLYLE